MSRLIDEWYCPTADGSIEADFVYHNPELWEWVVQSLGIPPHLVRQATMTETEWLASTDPAAMLEHLLALPLYGLRLPELRFVATDRKLRLFACGCCRLGADPIREIVDQYEARGVGFSDRKWAQAWCSLETKSVPMTIRASLLRCVFGNPFRPASCGWGDVNPAGEQMWRADWCLTQDVCELARAAYDKQDWQILPILADALEEAGCTDSDILGHLRGTERCPECLGECGFQANSTWVPCDTCDGGEIYAKESRIAGGRVPAGPRCDGCGGTGQVSGGRQIGTTTATSEWVGDEPEITHWQYGKAQHGQCHGTGHLPPVHCRGCWVLDLILGKE